jgi:hypothetical protein
LKSVDEIQCSLLSDSKKLDTSEKQKRNLGGAQEKTFRFSQTPIQKCF